MPWGEVNLKHGELRISGRRTKNGQQKVLYLSCEPLEIFNGAESVPQCDRVFVDDHGAPLRYDAILEETFQQACKRAKIVDGFTDADNGTRLPGFHDLRRTFARVSNQAGVPHTELLWRSLGGRAKRCPCVFSDARGCGTACSI